MRLLDFVRDRAETTPHPSPSLPMKTVRQLVNEFPELRRPVIHGLLREGETMNVVASPKVGKSWLVTDLAMAVATDCNPGTSPLQSLRLAMSLACTHFRLTPEEAVRGATLNAAKALGLEDRGVLRVGMRADLALWRIHEPAELAYWLSGDLLQASYSAGRKLG